MAKFLTTKGVSSYIEEIIIKAQKEVVLVSPYLQLSQSFLERLQDAEENNVKIIIVYGKSELSIKEMKSLTELKNLTLYFSKDLHAKCYFNEEEMVITSMNMYEFSEKNNREMGVHITESKDRELYNDAVRETRSIINAAEVSPIRRVAKKRKKVEPIPKQKKISKKGNLPRGFCIRCEDKISLDIEKPYCRDCFSTWSQFENPYYEEVVCHSCGEENNSTIVKPVCYSCYKRL